MMLSYAGYSNLIPSLPFDWEPAILFDLGRGIWISLGLGDLGSTSLLLTVRTRTM